MKIGIIGSIATPEDKLSTGGTEVFCANLANELAARGHTVYLFASADSRVDKRINLVASVPYSFLTVKEKFIEKFKRQPTGPETQKLIASMDIRTLFTAKSYEDKVDILHDNTCSPLTGSVSSLFRKPVVTTMHMPVNENSHFLHYPDLITQSTNTFISVSQFQARQYPKTKKHIYNGLDTQSYFFTPNNAKEHLIWIGRVEPTTDKGLKQAVIAAKQTGKELLFVPALENRTYFDQEIAPLLTEKTSIFPQFKSLEDKALFYGNAKAFLLPIMWEEPFGLTVIESMACGTPIIGFARGSFPELIEDGKTGFLVNPDPTDIRGDFIIKKTGLEGINEAIERLYGLSNDEYKNMRVSCRRKVENEFSISRMVDEYEKVYAELIG